MLPVYSVTYLAGSYPGPPPPNDTGEAWDDTGQAWDEAGEVNLIRGKGGRIRPSIVKLDFERETFGSDSKRNVVIVVAILCGCRGAWNGFLAN